ncbi:MATE family efflux transporter [Actinocrinis sp.]|uniref:MATE family efflux transporter n=1 Tax=Actinocrinis sp. TaxID=1920516 RepID=UPI002CA43B9F|nr:MATE family efflux transporter [Actinocrinis sp.]HXR70103.1 MATE family efflux transporter [Actinocrinis sp.]
MSSDMLNEPRVARAAEPDPPERPTRQNVDVSYQRIVKLSLPMVLSTATGVGAQVIATALIGRMGGTALYVRSVYNPVSYLFLALTTGLSITLQVAVAQAWGRGERDEISPRLGSMGRAGILVFAVFGGLLLALSGPLGDAVQLAADRRGEFQSFLAAMTGAAVLCMLGELCSAVLRGMGRTGVAAIITAIYVSLNLGIIIVVGLVLHGGLMAVPLASGIAGAAEIVLGLTVLMRAGAIRPRRFTEWRPQTPRLLLSIGVPVSASSIVLAVVNLLLLRIVAPSGQSAVAGFNVGYTVQTAIIVPAVGLGSAIAVLMNQSLGAGGLPASRTVFRRGLLLAVIGYAVVTLAVVLLGGPLANLMSGGSPSVAAQARHFVTIVGPTFGCTGLMLTVLTVLEQVGHGPLAVAMNTGYFVVILAVGWYAATARHEVAALYWTMAIAAAASLLGGLPIAARAAMRPRIQARA